MKQEVDQLRKERKEFENFIEEKDHDGNRYENQIRALDRLDRHIELLEQGVRVKELSNGFLVNGKYIVAAQKNRWRVKGKGQWYWFKSIPDFVEKYVNA